MDWHWFSNNVLLEEKEDWDHVAINLSGNFSSMKRSKKAANKGKSLSGLLSRVGLRAGGLNPIYGSNIWKSFGLPSMPYGCELWNDLTVTEHSSSFAAKRLQGISLSTHTECA